MYYKEFLRVRNVFVAFASVLILIALLMLVFGGHANVTVDMASAGALPHHIAAAAQSTPSSTTNVRGPGIEVSDVGRAPYSLLFALAGFVAAVLATVLGCCLASENCGHLEIAWTRPASRAAYASRLMLADVGGIAAMYVFTMLLSLAVIFLKGWQSHMYVDHLSWLVLARFVVYPLAWYGLVVGLTASVRSRAGAIAGFSWLGAGVLVFLMTADLPAAIHNIIVFLNYFNPLIYGSYSSGAEAARHVIMMSPVVAVSGLSTITILGIVAALVQWRRLEA